MSVATVTAVTALAGVALAGKAAYDANKRNKEAKQQIEDNKKDLYGSKVEPVDYEDRIGTKYSMGNMLPYDVSNNVQNSLPGIFQTAKQVNRNNQKTRDAATSGEFSNTMRQEGANIASMQRGELPNSVLGTVNRLLAENLGGSYNPSNPVGTGERTGFGTSAIQNDAFRRLGLNGFDVMQKATQMGAAWRTNVDSFMYKPQQANKDFYQPATEAMLAANKLQLERDERQYDSANNIIRADAMPNPQAVGQFGDTLTLNALQAQNDRNFNDALIGTVNGAAGVYSSLKPTGATRAGTGGSGATEGLGANEFMNRNNRSAYA